MYIFTLPTFELEVRFAADWEDFIAPEMDGSEDEIAGFQVWLAQHYGPFGHLLDGDNLCPADLHFALKMAEIPFSMEGEVKEYQAPDEGDVF